MWLLAGGGLALAALIAAAVTAGAGRTGGEDGTAGQAAGGEARIGEARGERVTVGLAPVAHGITVTSARVPGRPIVVIDPGHGGRDPGAQGASGTSVEKMLALELARQLRDRLAEAGRVRVALTREDDRYLSLDQRTAIARKLGAALYLSIHIDSAANAGARGASIYSLSDVASDADAARFAQRENAGAASSPAVDGTARGLLADLALRDRMNDSASLAERLARRAEGQFALRPQPHRFAAFHVLRSAGVPAVLFEAGYLSNAEDEALLLDPRHRERVVATLARAIEADIAIRTAR